MRLTGGLDRGRRLIAPRGARTRPTASRVREALFNILGPPAGPVLDLYAGTGALGMEALSRGAPQAVFVERDPGALSALRRNLRETKMDDRAEVIGADVRAALRRLGAQNDKFGIPLTSGRRRGCSGSCAGWTCSATARSSWSSTTAATAPPSGSAACS
jgi:16S rRNA (guanine966-N2)-methyltransferase